MFKNSFPVLNFIVQKKFTTKVIMAVNPIATYEEVKDLPNHPEKLLIDVRNPDELKEYGIIPSSINIPRK